MVWRPWARVTAAMASSSPSSETERGVLSAVARTTENPARMNARPSEVPADTARSKAGDPLGPRTSLRLSRKTVAVERRVDSSWRIMR